MMSHPGNVTGLSFTIRELTVLLAFPYLEFLLLIVDPQDHRLMDVAYLECLVARTLLHS